MSHDDRCGVCDGRGWVPAGGGEFATLTLCACLQPCPTCEDTGFVSRLRDDGKQVAAACRCSLLRNRIQAFNQVGLPSRFAGCTFETFKKGHPTVNQLVFMLRDWVKGFRPGVTGWLIHGPPGVGKTHLACAVASALALEKGVNVRFVDFFHLLQRLKAAFGGSGGEDLIEPLLSCDFLVIDELGKGRNTEWENGVVDELISARYNAGRTTLFTSNHAPEGGPSGDSLQERLGDRILSRLWELCTVHGVEGEDYRKRKR